MRKHTDGRWRLANAPSSALALATPLSRSDRALRFVFPRQRSVRWSHEWKKAPAIAGRGKLGGGIRPSHRPNPSWSLCSRARSCYSAPNICSLKPMAAFAPEITMPNVNLSRMTVEALMDLRKRVDEMLHRRRAELETQLERMRAFRGERVVRGARSPLSGRKVPPKYRGPSGETWAGRGARPRWVVAAIKGGKKLDDFLIDKSTRKRRKKRRSKR